MSTNEAAERLRDAIAEIVGDPDHAECRTTKIVEANCIVEGLFHRGYDAALAHERSAGAAPLDVERLREAIDSFIRSNTGFDVDDAEAIATEYARLSEGTDR